VARSLLVSSALNMEAVHISRNVSELLEYTALQRKHHCENLKPNINILNFAE
jgi:hypothetical protein